MGKILDGLIDTHLDQYLAGYSEEQRTETQILSVRAAAKKQFQAYIKQEIEQELTEAERQQIVEEARKLAEKEALQEKIKNIRSFIIQGIFIAFVVGLDVNQITNLYAIPAEADMPKTIWAIVILTGLLILVVLYWMFSEIFKLLSDRK